MERQPNSDDRRAHQHRRALRLVRTRLQMNQKSMASEIGIAQPTWCQGENGRSNPGKVVEAVLDRSEYTLPLTWNERLVLDPPKNRLVLADCPPDVRDRYVTFDEADAAARRYLNTGRAAFAGMAITWMGFNAKDVRQAARYRWRRGNWFRDRGRWEDAAQQLRYALVLLEGPELRGDVESQRMWVQVHLSLAQVDCYLEIPSLAVGSIEVVKRQDDLSPYGHASLAMVEAEYKILASIQSAGRDRASFAEEAVTLAKKARDRYQKIGDLVVQARDQVGIWRRSHLPPQEIALQLNRRGVPSPSGKTWCESDVAAFDLKAVLARQKEINSNTGWSLLLEGRALGLHPDLALNEDGVRILTDLRNAFGADDHGEVRDPELYVWSWYWMETFRRDFQGRKNAAREAEKKYRIGGIRRQLKQRRSVSCDVT